MKQYVIVITGKLKATNKRVALLMARSSKFRGKIAIEETQESVVKNDYKKPVKLKK